LSPPPPPRRHSPPGPARPAPPTPPPPPPGRPPRRNSSDARMRRCSKAWKSRRGRTRSVDFVTAVARFSFRTSPRRVPATPALSHRQSATQGISRDSLGDLLDSIEHDTPATASTRRLEATIAHHASDGPRGHAQASSGSGVRELHGSTIHGDV